MKAVSDDLNFLGPSKPTMPNFITQFSEVRSFFPLLVAHI